MRYRVASASISRAGPGTVSGRSKGGVRGLPGVRHVEANGLTGNVLIRFDPAASDEQTLLAAVADAAKDTETLLEDGPFPPVLEETVEGTVRRARVAVRGIDRDPQMARFVVNHLRRLFKVHAWASPLTGRVLIEYDDSRVGLNELLAYVRQVELPELPGEDRPAHPLDPAPLVQSASRTAAAGLGLAVLAVWRWAGGPVAPGRIKAAATAAGVITLLNGFPSLRNGLRRLLGPPRGGRVLQHRGRRHADPGPQPPGFGDCRRGGLGPADRSGGPTGGLDALRGAHGGGRRGRTRRGDPPGGGRSALP